MGKKLGKRERGLSRTSGCPWFAGRRSEAAAPHAPADSSGTVPRRRRSGEGERARSGRGASPRHEGAVGVVGLGREGVKEGAPRELGGGVVAMACGGARGVGKKGVRGSGE